MPIQDLKAQIARLPEQPGVYLYYNRAGETLYVGKAKVLRDRVRSYLGAYGTSPRIDALLKEVGSDKSKLLSATIWLTDMRTFDEMNAVWDAWLAEGCAPARATVEARLAAVHFTVEIGVIAAR